jgi:hypothetical protein
MKNVFKVFFFSLLLSCSIFEDSDETFIVEGIIVDKFTNLPTPNMRVSYDTCTPKVGVMFGYCSEIDEGSIYTDLNGKFSIPINYSELNDNVHFYLSETQDYYASGIQQRYKVSRFLDNPNLKLFTVKYAKTIIKINNLTPFDSNDKFEIVYFNAKNDLEQIIFQEDKINDFGNSKEDGFYYIWNGEDVNTELVGRIKSGYKVYFRYSVTKNGKTSEFESETKILDPNIQNEFVIEY